MPNLQNKHKKSNISNQSNNQTLQVLIDEAEIHKFKIDLDYLETLDEFKEKIAYFENLEKAPFNIILEKIAELKNKLVSDREKSIAEINKTADEKIEILNKWEAAFKAESGSKEMLDYFANVKTQLKNDLKKYEECLKSLRFTEEERKKQKEYIAEVMSDLGMDIEIYKKKLAEFKLLTREELEAQSLFGKINVNEVYSN